MSEEILIYRDDPSTTAPTKAPWYEDQRIDDPDLARMQIELAHIQKGSDQLDAGLPQDPLSRAVIDKSLRAQAQDLLRRLYIKNLQILIPYARRAVPWNIEISRN